MKAQDLMIGDWLKCSDPTPFRITDIETEKGTSYFRVTGDDGWVVDGGELEPIPLTGEILEKNGFERVPQQGCVNNYHWMMEKYEEESDGLLFRIKAFNNPFRGMFVSIDNPSACETILFGKQIEFVHELQHALRLCEIDKTIELHV